MQPPVLVLTWEEATMYVDFHQGHNFLMLLFSISYLFSYWTISGMESPKTDLKQKHFNVGDYIHTSIVFSVKFSVGLLQWFVPVP